MQNPDRQRIQTGIRWGHEKNTQKIHVECCVGTSVNYPEVRFLGKKGRRIFVLAFDFPMASAAAEAEPWWESYDDSGRGAEVEGCSEDSTLALQLERAHTQLRAKSQLLTLAEDSRDRLAAELATLQTQRASQEAVSKAELEQERQTVHALRTALATKDAQLELKAKESQSLRCADGGRSAAFETRQRALESQNKSLRTKLDALRDDERLMQRTLIEMRAQVEQRESAVQARLDEAHLFEASASEAARKPALLIGKLQELLVEQDAGAGRRTAEASNRSSSEMSEQLEAVIERTNQRVKLAEAEAEAARCEAARATMALQAAPSSESLAKQAEIARAARAAHRAAEMELRQLRRQLEKAEVRAADAEGECEAAAARAARAEARVAEGTSPARVARQPLRAKPSQYPTNAASRPKARAANAMPKVANAGLQIRARVGARKGQQAQHKYTHPLSHPAWDDSPAMTPPRVSMAVPPPRRMQPPAAELAEAPAADGARSGGAALRDWFSALAAELHHVPDGTGGSATSERISESISVAAGLSEDSEMAASVLEKVRRLSAAAREAQAVHSAVARCMDAMRKRTARAVHAQTADGSLGGLMAEVEELVMAENAAGNARRCAVDGSVPMVLGQLQAELDVKSPRELVPRAQELCGKIRTSVGDTPSTHPLPTLYPPPYPPLPPA